MLKWFPIGLIALFSFACTHGSAAGSCGADGVGECGNTGGWTGNPNDYPGPPPDGIWGPAIGSSASPPWGIDYLGALPQGEEQRASLCARHNQDVFARWYCQASTPAITGAADVLQGLGLRNANDLNPNVGFALLAASNSLTVRGVSAMNPRGLVYAASPNQFVVTALSRGDNLMEIAAYDPNLATLHFYALHVTHACDDANNCGFADRFSSVDETAWAHVAAYDEIDLHNTALDCLRCHEAGGHDWVHNTGTARQLLLQEVDSPASHWMRGDTAAAALIRDFNSAHPLGSEDYAGIPAARLATPDFENHGGNPQAFAQALTRVFGYVPDANAAFVAASPDNAAAPTDGWQAWFNQALAGNTLSPPYWQVNTSDPELSREAAAAFQNPNMAAPWIDAGNLYSGDAAAVAGITTPAGLDVTTLVTFKCGNCHNGRFPGATRNNFDVRDFPNHLSADMRQLIKNRLQADSQSAQRMPPAIFGDLTFEQQALILDALSP